ncbi:hypothetical protein B0T22DRAFT_295788 [Podospora appendiculata]|uniref:Uncharacterized protein n=1 Tax=Podospora appendiculata TaxID=314037 RepID=A0AAE0X1V5_9PEZI|nr:hypothetical protein B0T22DRAFT_295788 [Podospora appendiculata]
MRTQSIIPLAYHRYRELWNRTVLVSGSRKSLRLYSLRVGAGLALNGPLEPAVRNRVLSHTTAVFEASYQPQHLRENLQKLAFQDEGVLKSRELFQMLSHALLIRDEYTPIYIPEIVLQSSKLQTISKNSPPNTKPPQQSMEQTTKYRNGSAQRDST